MYVLGGQVLRDDKLIMTKLDIVDEEGMAVLQRLLVEINLLTKTFGSGDL